MKWQPLEPATATLNGSVAQANAVNGRNVLSFVNREYVVTGTPFIHPEYGKMVHLSIRRQDRKAATDWRHFQQIKNELCGEEAEGIQLYPAQSRVMDTANQYHLYVRLEGGWDLGVPADLACRNSLAADPLYPKARQRPFDPALGWKETPTERLAEVLSQITAGKEGGP